MSDSSGNKDEAIARETVGTEREALDSKAPHPQEPVEPFYQKIEYELLLGEPDLQNSEAPPGTEGPQTQTKPQVSEGLQDPEDAEGRGKRTGDLNSYRTTRRRGSDKNETQKIQIQNYKDGKSGDSKPLLLCESNENEDPRQRTQGEEDALEKGSNSKGNARRYSRRSHPERSGPLKRRVSNGGSKGEVPAEDALGGTPAGSTGGRTQKAGAQIDQKCPRDGGDKVSENNFHLKIPTRRNSTPERPVEGEELSYCEVGKKAFTTS